MKLKANLRIALLIVIAHLFVITMISAQQQSASPSANELYDTIERMDSVLFTAFNNRDTTQFKEMFTSDLEFYHDKGGLTYYPETIAFMRSTAKTNNGLRRDLVKGSLEVYPIPGYGAMEIGAHTFCHMENGKRDCGTFKFVHIWQHKDGKWKITRVVSYGH